MNTFNLKKEDFEIFNKWYADLYDQVETYTDDVSFILDLVGVTSKRIFEVCCGTGRIILPLLKRGHNITGIDVNKAMLDRLYSKYGNSEDLNIIQGDALITDWGSGYDVVILGGNIMINIQTVMCYEQAQYKFIKKAADALKIGGHLYLDCDLYAHPENIFVSNQESIIFEGKDAYGTLGRCISCWEKYDSDTQIASGVNKIELTDLNGNKISFERYYEEHIPTIINLRKWISEAGLKIVYEYGNYNRDTINEQTTKAIIWAVKE